MSMGEDGDKTVADKLSTTQASVCPDCYSYLTAQQFFSGELNRTIWAYYCPHCKKQTEPKLMDINERKYLNVRAMRKAKEGTA